MSAPAPAARPPFVPALTGVRAFAATWVMCLHLTAVTAVLLPAAAARGFGFVALPGALGVDVFFVLSGFIISYNYETWFVDQVAPRRFGEFLRARLARIYPVHIVLLAALVAAVWGAGIDAATAASAARWSGLALVESVLLIHAWLGHTDVWNAVSWSISLEWLAYLTFPWLSRLARAVGRRSSPVVAVIMVVVAMAPALRSTVERLVPGTPALPPLQIISEFLTGCITYQVFRAQRWTRLARYPGWTLLLIVGAAATLQHLGAPTPWVVPLVPVMLLGLAYGHGTLARVFAHRALVYGGKISFALYMTHYLWLWVMHSRFPLETLAADGVPLRLAWVAAHAVPMPFIAAATYHLIEEPARHWLVGKRRR